MKKFDDVSRIDLITNGIKRRHLTIYKRKENLIKELLTGKISLPEYNVRFVETIKSIDETYEKFISNVKLCNRINNECLNESYEFLLSYLEKFVRDNAKIKKEGYNYKYLNNLIIDEVLKISSENPIKETNKKKCMVLI